MIVTSPIAGDLRARVLASSILQLTDTVVPPPTKLFGAFVQHDPLPTMDARGSHISAPADDVPVDVALRVAAKSVVQVQGTACGYGVTGSGWVVAPHLVVTNVHVVAGQRDTIIRLHDGRRLPAVPVAISPDNDVAVLRVETLDLPALQFARRPAGGTAGAIVGFPEGGRRTVRSARLGVRERVRTSDAFGRRQVERDVVAFRGVVQHGNSGGPVLDPAGHVLATVFAASDNGPVGGFAVPNGIVEAVVHLASTKRVSSGCGG